MNRDDNKFVIGVYSHHFVIYPPVIQTAIGPSYASKIGVIKEILKKYIQWSVYKLRNKFVREEKAHFYSVGLNGKEYRLPITELNNTINDLVYSGISRDNIIIQYHDPNDTVYDDVDNKLQDKFTLKPIQEEAIDYCLDYNTHRSKLIELITGEGKSLVSMGVVARLKSRLLMIVRGQYVEKWYLDILNAMNITKDEIYVARGGDNLRDLFLLATNNKLDHIKAIIIPNRTMQNYITQYENLGEDYLRSIGYTVMPYDYCQALKVKVLLVDEGHQDFHFNYKLMLYTHCLVSVTSTATLVPDDPFLKKMGRILFPMDTRFNPGTVNNYVDCIGVTYRFNQPKYIRSTGRQGYNHVAFEKSILRHVPTEKSYYEMIATYIDKYYIPNKKPGYKCIVFCATIKMCDHLTKYLNERYIGKGLDIRKYIGESDYNDLLEPDIRVTTPGSAGTAVDIPGLYLGINTIAIGSTALNKQIIGRLREMKKGHPIHPDGDNPKYVWLTCTDIPQHLKYHDDKHNVFKDKMRSYYHDPYPHDIGGYRKTKSWFE